MRECEQCNDTGWYGDNGPGIRGNNEYHPCDYCAKGKFKESRINHDYCPVCAELKAELNRYKRLSEDLQSTVDALSSKLKEKISALRSAIQGKKRGIDDIPLIDLACILEEIKVQTNEETE